VSLHLGGDDQNNLLDTLKAMVRVIDEICWEKEEKKVEMKSKSTLRMTKRGWPRFEDHLYTMISKQGRQRRKNTLEHESHL
jgi:hypothetical protein